MALLDEFIGTDIKHWKDFVKVTDAGDIETMTGLENIREALFRRLMTRPGSIVHRPDYGVGVVDFQNAPASMALWQKLAQRISEQFSRDPRVKSVLGVSTSGDDERPDKFTISVRVEIRGYGETQYKFTPFGDT